MNRDDTTDGHGAAAAESKWKQAVIDELVNCHIYSSSHEIDPRKALHDAICWNVEVSLDPRVSSSAEELIQRGAAAEREKVANWMMQRGYTTGHGESMEDLLAELDWQIAENWNRAMINGIETEREACIEAARTVGGDAGAEVEKLIRARGQDV